MFHVPNHYRFTEEGHPLASKPSDGNFGAFVVRFGSREFFCIASEGMGWEHVSVSAKRAPTWEEMCFFKSLFWDDDDIVVQFHPKKSEYVNDCKTALHLWRERDKEFPHPPKYLVGGLAPSSTV